MRWVEIQNQMCQMPLTHLIVLFHCIIASIRALRQSCSISSTNIRIFIKPDASLGLWKWKRRTESRLELKYYWYCFKNNRWFTIINPEFIILYFLLHMVAVTRVIALIYTPTHDFFHNRILIFFLFLGRNILLLSYTLSHNNLPEYKWKKLSGYFSRNFSYFFYFFTTNY